MTNTRKKASPLYAYCWRGGQIEFGKKVPEGALRLLNGSPLTVRETVGGAARHGHRDELMLVPGVPEAINDDLALKAVRLFIKRLQPGFRFSQRSRNFTWVCEFCFRTANTPVLPQKWELLLMSAVCPACQKKVKADGGIAKAKGGAYAGDRRDPRELEYLTTAKEARS